MTDERYRELVVEEFREYEAEIARLRAALERIMAESYDDDVAIPTARKALSQ